MPTFKKQHRLLHATQFKRVFHKPIKSSDACFVVLARPNLSENHRPRLGLAIAKKQLKRSVDRNRIKRIIREYFRLQVDSNCGLDFVVMIRSSVKDYSNEKLTYYLGQHFKRLVDKQTISKT